MPELAASRIAVLAVCTIGGLSGGGIPSTVAARSGSNERCDASVAAYEQVWHGTGAWHRLAPYPTARDASPTDSIGVWLERSRAADGTLELRRVSAESTVLARASGAACEVTMRTYRRTYDASAVARAFTDDDLRALVQTHRAGIVYVWSPGMPLSLAGMEQARDAARTLGIAFTAVVADARPGELEATGVDSAATRSMSSVELVYRNANIHYPSATFYRDGKLLGSAVPGFKARDTYVALAREAFAAVRPSEPVTSAPELWVDHTARVNTVRTVATVRPVGFFFKPVIGTDLVSYTSDGQAYLFDLGMRTEQRIPATVDPVPTPDGRFLTRPGLFFYWMPALTGGDTTSLFRDPELPDEYQTASILKQTKEVTRYRVVTGWRMGARVRDYDVTFGRDGKPQRIHPLASPTVPCAERMFSLPISAKGSREIGVYDVMAKTNRVIDVTEDGTGCKDVLDLGFASGKLSFSYDGSALAFATSRINTDIEGPLLKPEEGFYKDALVLYRKTGRIVSLSTNRPLSAMTFPEFLPDGRVMLLDQASRFRTVEVFRVVEVK